MNPIMVIGVGMGPGDLSRRALKAIERAQVLAGGRRQLDMFPQHEGEYLVLQGHMDHWIEEVRRLAQERRVVVLASGDPGFYGIAQRLTKALGAQAVEIIPNVTTVQAAFARIKEPWQEAKVVSLHGRDPLPLLAALPGTQRLAVYTDPANTPAVIAGLLLERGQEDWRMWVLEDLGTNGEKVTPCTLEEAQRGHFSPLNLVVLARQSWPEPLALGQPEEAYAHQAGLITKSEVRVVALAKLELGPGQVLWDLGAGSGSLGLEASLLMPGGRVVAVERDPQRAAQIALNRRRYGVAMLEVVEAELPQALAELPTPQRVFVGGGGQALEATVEEAARRLPPTGVAVVSLVRLAALESARRALASQGLETEVTQVQVSRSASLAGDLYLKAQNPVWLLKGKRPA